MERTFSGLLLPQLPEKEESENYQRDGKIYKQSSAMGELSF